MKTLTTHLSRLDADGFTYEVAVFTDRGGTGYAPVLRHGDDGILQSHTTDPNVTCFTPAHAIKQVLIRTHT